MSCEIQESMDELGDRIDAATNTIAATAGVLHDTSLGVERAAKLNNATAKIIEKMLSQSARLLDRVSKAYPPDPGTNGQHPKD